MSVPTLPPPPNYGRLASSYSFWEYLVFGKQLQRCRLAWWRELESCQNILLLGDGNGRFSTHLLENHPSVRITSLDSSSAMLNAAAKRRRNKGISEQRISTIQADIREWIHKKEESFDAVVAQFFFDNFEEQDLQSIINIVKEALLPGGKLLVSEFNIPQDTHLGNCRARFTLGWLYAVFRILTGLTTHKLIPHTPLLREAGFDQKKAVFFSQKTLISQVFTATGDNQRDISL
ncbi:MAG: class I SAM-dependent methyltransferase [Verrucomicrobia bacterium]|nr:class I SAM-dependent methyltransferase [Verrucomicrobiota bacterium]